MAQYVEPMDTDSDFDNKENSLHHSNVLPFTEKGYEELDVSELNMKLRYSISPASSPMSKSYTANCLDNRSLESGDDSLNNTVNENINLTRSLNSTITKNDNVIKSLKALPLQVIQTDQFVDNSNVSTIRRPLETNATRDNGHINVLITAPNDNDENLSLPSSNSSALQTPATTPTKDILVKDGGSPIMRGLKSVLNMFRSSQSPIPPSDNDNMINPTILRPDESTASMQEIQQHMLVSTPIMPNKKKEMSPTKRISPPKDSSIVFNQDLERELQWKDETTIFFSHEKIPIHKLLFNEPQSNKQSTINTIEISQHDKPDLNCTTEFMDISYNDSIKDSTMTAIQTNNKNIDNTLTGDSDNEFVDCETTFTKNVSQINEDINKTPVVDYQDLDLTTAEQIENKCSHRLKQIIFNTTQEILDATLSVRPEDLVPENCHHTKDTLSLECHNIDNIGTHNEALDSRNIDEIDNIVDAMVLENMLDNCNITKTNGVPYKDDPINENLTAISPVKGIDLPMEDMNQSISQNSFDETLLLNQKSDSGDNINTVTNKIIIVEHKVQDVETTSMRENIPENLLNETYDVSNFVSDFTNIEKSDFSLLTKMTADEETKSMPLFTSAGREVTTVKEGTQLPINIPLPDDDIEKDLVADGTTETNSLSASQSLDVEDVVKLTVGKAETIAVEYFEGITKKDNILNDSDKNVMLATQAADITKKSSELKTLSGSQAWEPIMDNGILHDVFENCSVQIDKKKQEIDSICNSQNVSYLSDIINKTICVNKIENEPQPLVSNTLETGSTIADHIEITTEVVNFELANIDNLTSNMNAEIALEDIKIEQDLQNISPDNDKPIIEMNTVENESVIFPTKDAIVAEEAFKGSCDVILAHDVISAIENKKDSIESEINYSMPVEITSAVESLLTAETAPINDNTERVDEELVLSKSNSPFLLVTEDNIKESTDEISEELSIAITLPSKDEIANTSLNSPPITTKGYYFNFDDMESNPFTTKTNIRMSPPLIIPHEQDAIMNEYSNTERPLPKKNFRRKSLPDKKKPILPKRKLNSTFDRSMIQKTEKSVEISEAIPTAKIDLDLPATVTLSPKNVTIEEKEISDNSYTLDKTVVVTDKILEIEPKISCEEKNEHIVETVTDICVSTSDTNVNEYKTTSSSEQSTYFSAGTSSTDSSVHCKNVFNLPEIDDSNFNPFATKCKMQQSPPPSLHIEDPFVTKSKMKSSIDTSVAQDEDNTAIVEDKIEAELMEKDNSTDLSNTTTSSKATDERNITTREVHTEDEDTAEGPFLDADEVNSADKMSDFDGENIDMMHFNELPAQNNDDNIDNGEMFIDAEAFEFLLHQNKSNMVVDSGKESLFLKFDPLFAKTMSAMTSDGVVASLAKLRQSTPTKELPSTSLRTNSAGPSNVSTSQSVDMNMNDGINDDNIAVSKPMMVVPPAVNSVTPRNKSLTPSRSNRHSITFTSPAMAVIDRLLSLSTNNSPDSHTTVPRVSREQSEADIALSQLRELLADKEINVYNLKAENKELRERLNTLESHLKILEAESKEKLKKINQLNETLIQKTKMNKSMAVVVEEYERTIASLIAETEQDKKNHAEERMKLISERNEQIAHLASMEVSFNDLHSKYEKSKQVIFQCKANEDLYKKSIKDSEENVIKAQNNYELLKQHATSKLNHANQELEKINKSHEAEVLKLNAMIKRKDLHITSLEESLVQKTKANEELTAICDELINKVS